MCRLLFVKSKEEFDVSKHLRHFAEISKDSEEYQGHGWGCAYLVNGLWKHYKNINPIWEDDLEPFGSTTQLIAHARSAFEDKDIVIENNMPFYDDKYVFAFNGELRGVKLKAEGRIGAEKIFNYIKRFDTGDMHAALEKGVGIIKKRTKHFKAVNIIMTDKEKAYVSTSFTERPGYFTLWFKENEGMLQICSTPYPSEEGWQKIENDTVRCFE